MLFGVTGRIGSGKDQFCQFIKELGEEHGLKVVRHGWADKLKVSAARSLGCPVDWTVEQCVDFCNELKEDADINVYVGKYLRNIVSISGREFLQFYGTESHRQVFSDTFWVDSMLPPDNGDFLYTWQDFFDGADIGVIPDTRFENEADRIHNWTGIVVDVVRPGILQQGHISEKGLPSNKIDFTIINDGTLDDLRTKAQLFLQQWGLLD